jgi:hypothetical protein
MTLQSKYLHISNRMINLRVGISIAFYWRRADWWVRRDMSPPWYIAWGPFEFGQIVKTDDI